MPALAWTSQFALVVIGAVGTFISLIAAVASAKAAMAARDQVKESSNQWNMAKVDSQIAMARRRIGILHALFEECVRIQRYYKKGGTIPQETPAWRYVRVEVYEFSPAVGRLMDSIDSDVIRYNALIHYAEENYWRKRRADAGDNKRKQDIEYADECAQMQGYYNHTLKTLSKALRQIEHALNDLESEITDTQSKRRRRWHLRLGR